MIRINCLVNVLICLFLVNSCVSVADYPEKPEQKNVFQTVEPNKNKKIQNITVVGKTSIKFPKNMLDGKTVKSGITVKAKIWSQNVFQEKEIITDSEGYFFLRNIEIPKDSEDISKYKIFGKTLPENCFWLRGLKLTFTYFNGDLKFELGDVNAIEKSWIALKRGNFLLLEQKPVELKENGSIVVKGMPWFEVKADDIAVDMLTHCKKYDDLRNAAENALKYK